METSKTITAEEVTSIRERQSFLPKNLGGTITALRFEQAVYHTASAYCRQYAGATWKFVILSNGGMFMYPDMPDEELVDGKVEFANPENYSNVMVTPEALGIICCMYAASEMSHNITLSNIFHSLRTFALDHPEVSAIFEAVD